MTLYRQKFDTFIRRYDDVGYIVNKINFIDRVVDASGLVFLSALSREPQDIGKLSEKIAKSFIDADIEEIKEDAIAFYAMLEEAGFIVSGITEEELDCKDARFSYALIEPKTFNKDSAPVLKQGKKDTQDFLEEHFKDRPQFMSLQIELTSRCNERCIHCYIPHEDRTSDIAPELFYDVLEQCREMGVLDLILSGGEALLHPQFCDFLRRAKEYDFSVAILSNLTLLNDEIISAMKEIRLSSVQVSLYSMKAEIHDSISQLPGSFEKTKSAVLRLVENDIPVQISCPVMKQNKDCYADVLKWAHDHKCRAHTDFLMMGRYDNTTDNLDNRLSLEETEKLLQVIVHNDTEYQEGIFSADIAEAEKRDISNDILCGVCITSACMVANGTIYPCPGWQSYACGNVKEKPLHEIWKNSPEVKYLRGLRKKDFPMCVKCPDRNFCDLCIMRNAHEANGDMFKINEHFCKVVALNRKIALEWKEKQLAGIN